MNDTTRPESKRVLCGVLGILLGWLGIHKFVLGYTLEGVLHIVASFCFGIGGLIGLIEGILYLVKSDQEFVDTYQLGRRTWF